MALPTVCWLSSFEVGIPEIDAEHRAIVDVLAGIVAHVAAGRFGAVPEHCRALRDAAIRHWSNEERWLAARGFPRLAEHRQAHRELDDSIRAMQDRCGGTCRADLAEDCATVWFTAILDHIVRYDSTFAGFVHGR